MSDATYRLVDAFVAELVRLGVRQVCVCPGSRSTPLALAFARQYAPGEAHAAGAAEITAGWRLWMHLDERSAAYFALGLAKASRRPVALVCTSGTAAANFLPAVVEACYGHVPLLVCTADRPPELHHVGANQTIEQQGLYGRQVRLAMEMPVPDGSEAGARFARVVAGRAVAAALGAPAGPVHLNFQFREPLLPEGEGRPAAGTEHRHVPALGEALRRPAPRVPGAEALDALAALVRGARRGLIVCGGQDDAAFPAAVTQVAALAGFPLLADPLSGLRCGPQHGELVIDSYDTLLRDTAFIASMRPELVLRFGAAPTSKPLLQYLEQQVDCPQVLITDLGWTDPTLVAQQALEADPAACCIGLAAALAGHRADLETTEWAQRWRRAAGMARRALEEGVREFAAPFEGRVFRELAALLPAGVTLVAGNSMPVRDLDTFFPGGGQGIRFLANRGASGIDGVVSTALGVAAVSAGPTVLVIGDLSFYHDMNGLLAAKQYGLPLTIVLVNNDGGGIFSFLPQADHAEHFEQLFGTPHGLDFAPAAVLYGGRYTLCKRWDDFRDAVGMGLAAGGLHIVEVRTDRAENVRQHRDLWRRVSVALREAEGAGAAQAPEAATEPAVATSIAGVAKDLSRHERGAGVPPARITDDATEVPVAAHPASNMTHARPGGRDARPPATKARAT